MRLKAIASPKQAAQELAVALSAGLGKSAGPPVPAAVPSSTRLD